MIDTASRLYYLLTTDDNQTPHVASFEELFPDGLEVDTTSEEVAAMFPGDLYHGGTWAVVACEAEFLDAACASVGGGADDEALAAAYLADDRASLERKQIANAKARFPGNCYGTCAGK